MFPHGSMVCLGALLAVFSSGCGTSVGTVGGKVTLKSQPVTAGEIVFRSREVAENEFFGEIIQDGTYHVSYRTKGGLPPAKYEISITHYTQRNGKPLPEGEKGVVLRSEGRVRKNLYVFEKDIAAGKNELDFELTLGKKTKLIEDDGTGGVGP